MAAVWQEFYCNDCHGYIKCKINMHLNQTVVVVCPKCGRKHPRVIKNGHIVEDGYGNGSNTNEICPTMSAYSKEPFTQKMRDLRYNARDGVKIEDEPGKKRDPASDQIIQDSWFERFGGGQSGYCSIGDDDDGNG